MSIVIRRQRNKIDSIREGNEWISEEGNIADYFGFKFEELFSSNHPMPPGDLDELLHEDISELENDLLTKIPTKEEIKHSVWSLHPLKSSGPYGFSVIFFRNY